jgi:hypothetical protein
VLNSFCRHPYHLLSPVRFKKSPEERLALFFLDFDFSSMLSIRYVSNNY